uniref:MIF4G domain-containing protein n=1 Tax=Syphacia muris TaxID=451379 RepID=A0A0N5ALY5_9BILA
MLMCLSSDLCSYVCVFVLMYPVVHNSVSTILVQLLEINILGDESFNYCLIKAIIELESDRPMEQTAYRKILCVLNRQGFLNNV